jgi:hypothetical protein
MKDVSDAGEPGSRLREAVAALYSADPEEFIARRKELASQARAAGDKAAAKDIGALAKPTRSAWLVNHLVRSDPSVPDKLAELGGQLRAGEAALDGPAIRKLSVARRELVDALARQAVADSGASAALREEVAETLNAALADPEVAAQVAAGTLVRAAHWAGFGPGIGTALGAAPATASTGPATTGSAATGRAKAAATGPASRRQQAEQAAADAALAVQAAAAAERAKQQAVRDIETQIAEHREQVARDEHTVIQAQRELALAQRNLADTQLRLADTEQSLAAARQELKEAGAQARQAVAAQRKTQQALDRLRG